MDVKVLRKTKHPERLVCQAARGDYFDGYVGDTEYAELMETVDFDLNDLKAVSPELTQEVEEAHSVEDVSADFEDTIEARTKSFIEKQLSRGHYGPWEHPQITFAVREVSRVTMAQITRHRHMTFDVQSQRYVDFSDKEVVTPKSLVDENHFSRETGTTELEEDQEILKEQYEEWVDEALQRYQKLVDNGVPKEDARFVLPLGTPVNMTFSGNARTFLHLLDMRKKANAQWEIRELSNKLLDELSDWMPYTYEYYAEHGPNKLAP